MTRQRTPKLRGQKRYYRDLQAMVETTNLDLEADDDNWYDLWHEHPDFHGYGDLSRRHYRAHLRVLFNLFHKLCSQAQAFPRPYQLWVDVYERDSSMSGVYFHTKNPNSDNFPFHIEDINWKTAVPSFLKSYLKDPAFKLGVIAGEPCGDVYIIQREDLGISL